VASVYHSIQFIYSSQVRFIHYNRRKEKLIRLYDKYLYSVQFYSIRRKNNTSSFFVSTLFLLYNNQHSLVFFQCHAISVLLCCSNQLSIPIYKSVTIVCSLGKKKEIRFNTQTSVWIVNI
jgi:hypothetical protein